MAFSLKNLGLGGGESKEGPMTVSEDSLAAPAGGTLSWLPRAFVEESVVWQMKFLGGLFLVLLLAIATLVFFNNRSSTYGTAYVAASGEMRMLSQRLAKASTLALQGNPVAFTQLKDSRETFSRLLERLTTGGEIVGTSVPASPTAVQTQLESLTKVWGETDKDAMTVIAQENNLIALGKNVAIIDTENPVVLELAEQVAALKLQAGAGAREIASANQLVMLTNGLPRTPRRFLLVTKSTPRWRSCSARIPMPSGTSFKD